MMRGGCLIYLTGVELGPRDDGVHQPRVYNISNREGRKTFNYGSI
jgi:hypothetical protein